MPKQKPDPLWVLKRALALTVALIALLWVVMVVMGAVSLALIGDDDPPLCAHGHQLRSGWICEDAEAK